ncbi:MAG: hypothetical protein NTV31_03765 [Bacteroidia bacterium]|nr:hypothetical protein [Bacteroidia bacterium]
MRNPAAEMTAISLLDDEQAIMVFAALPRQIFYGEINPTLLPGLAKTATKINSIHLFGNVT